VSLEQELAQLRSENQALQEQLQAVRQELAAALERLAELEQQARPPASFFKPDRPKRTGEKTARRPRKADANRGRKRATPTRVVKHALERCRTCGYRLAGESLARRREVIELPAPVPVEVIEHQVIKRWCPRCERWEIPTLDLSGQVLGQGRMGVRIASLVAYLRSELRLPIRAIASYLDTLHHLRLSTGEIVGLLHQVQQALAGTVEELKGQVRASRLLHADETGWREDGQNGYLWTFSTPGAAGVRYYEYDHSRAGAVVGRLLGADFRGHLLSDFYGAYNVYTGPHQRCWVHLGRDLHELKERHPDDPEVLAWAGEVRALYDQAQQFLATPDPPGRAERERKYAGLVEQVDRLGLQFAPAVFKGHACYGLCKRLLRHRDELFQFVRVEGLPADNNLAERSLRPLVVIRKISGGSRSPRGSQTRAALASLFGTWQARALNSFQECLTLLSQTPLP